MSATANFAPFTSLLELKCVAGHVSSGFAENVGLKKSKYDVSRRLNKLSSEVHGACCGIHSSNVEYCWVERTLLALSITYPRDVSTGIS